MSSGETGSESASASASSGVHSMKLRSLRNCWWSSRNAARRGHAQVSGWVSSAVCQGVEVQVRVRWRTECQRTHFWPTSDHTDFDLCKAVTVSCFQDTATECTELDSELRYRVTDRTDSDLRFRRHGPTWREIERRGASERDLARVCVSGKVQRAVFCVNLEPTCRSFHTCIFCHEMVGKMNMRPRRSHSLRNTSMFMMKY